MRPSCACLKVGARTRSFVCCIYTSICVPKEAIPPYSQVCKEIFQLRPNAICTVFRTPQVPLIRRLPAISQLQIVWDASRLFANRNRVANLEPLAIESIDKPVLELCNLVSTLSLSQARLEDHIKTHSRRQSYSRCGSKYCDHCPGRHARRNSPHQRHLIYRAASRCSVHARYRPRCRA